MTKAPRAADRSDPPALATSNIAASETGLRDALRRPLRDLRISVLDQCNFRCPYFMPADYSFLNRRSRLSHDEILRVARAAARLGVSKIRVSGGEPLLDKKLPYLVAGLADIQGLDDLALTTNAMLLEPKARQLADAGLKRVTVSLDSLDERVFRHMSGGRGDLKSVLEGIDAAARAGLDPIKLNVVVQRGVNHHTVIDLLDHFRGTGHIVRLIEFMDVGNSNNWNVGNVVPSGDLLAEIDARWPVRRLDKNYAGEVARRYEYQDGAGEIGFVSSVTQPFCGDCNRARLTANGMFYTCLFASGGTDLSKPLQNKVGDDELTEILARAWRNRSDRYSETRHAAPRDVNVIRKVEMHRIGG